MYIKVLSLYTSVYMKRYIIFLMGKDYKNTALFWTPVEYFSRRAESPVFDGDLIKQTVFHPVDQVPEAVQNRFIKHVQAVHNVKDPDNTKLVIREDYATTGTGALATEAREKRL